MPDDLVINKSVVIPQTELVVKFSRSSGPGGQGVNTADSRVQLSFDLANSGSMSEFMRERALARLSSKLIDGVITITASEQRSQLQNRKAAEQRLAQILREAIAPPARTRRATRPTKGSVERRLNTKKTRSVTKRLRRSGASNHD